MLRAALSRACVSAAEAFDGFFTHWPTAHHVLPKCGTSSTTVIARSHTSILSDLPVGLR